MRRLVIVFALVVAGCGSPAATVVPAAAGGTPTADDAVGLQSAVPSTDAAPHLCAPPALRRPRGV